MQQYQRVTYGIRCQIYAYLETKISVAEIASLVGLHRSTIYREIKRNSDKSYIPKVAEIKAKARFIRCRRKRILINPDKFKRVQDYILKDWSPEQIQERLSLEGKSFVSKQTIYNEINKHHIELKKKLRSYKAQGRKKRLHRRKRPEWMKSIHHRPSEVVLRLEPGHWERDTMFTKDRKQLIVFLERHSRYIKIEKVIEPYRLNITEQMKRMLRETKTEVLSITNDNGNEFLDGKEYDIPVYYCDPMSPHQKGSVENSIKLIRQYIKRDTDITKLTDKDIKKIEDRLNHRPRKCLDYRTPYEVLYGKTVALAS